METERDATITGAKLAAGTATEQLIDLPWGLETSETRLDHGDYYPHWRKVERQKGRVS